MKLNRRDFLGASLVTGGALIASPAMAASIVGSTAAPVSGVIGEALAALERHAGQVSYRDRLGIADYTAHSGKFRFHIVDVDGGKIIRSLLVSHGRGSDPANSGFAKRFSNVPGSNASSRGSYLCGQEYVGQHGRSRRLHGLEAQNDAAYERAIVIHGADYVDVAMARDYGRVGRSLGCFAFERTEIADVLELLGEGRLLYTAGQDA